MNYIFYFLIVISIIAGAINGRLTDVVNAILSGAELSVKVAFSLIGIMAFWLGMMKIAKQCGLIEIIAKLIKPVTKCLFNEIPENSPAIGDIAMSFSANAFGLTNAATPIGIKAMEELQKLKLEFPRIYKCLNKQEYEFKNMLTVAMIITYCAYLRKESRGAHYRTDFTGELEKSVHSLITKEQGVPDFVK